MTRLEGLVCDTSTIHDIVTDRNSRARALVRHATRSDGIPLRIPTFGCDEDLTGLARLGMLSGGHIVVSPASAVMMIAAAQLADAHTGLTPTDAQAVIEAQILSWTVATTGPEQAARYEQLGVNTIDINTA